MEGGEYSLFLALIVGVVSVFQQTDERLYAACIFSIITLGYMIAGVFIDSGAYYIIAGLLDLSIIILLSYITKVVSTTILLQRISILSIILNTYGFYAYMTYQEPHFYNMAFILLYLYAVVVLTRKDGENDKRGYSVVDWTSRLRLVFGASYSGSHNNKAAL